MSVRAKSRRIDNEVRWEDDFIGGGLTTGIIGDNGWSLTDDGTGIAVDATVFDTGGLTLTTGTTTNNDINIFTPITGLALGGGEEFIARIKLSSVADVQCVVGFTDAVAGTDGTDGLYFEVDTAASAFWRTAKVVTTTKTATNTTITAGTAITDLRIVVNSDATKADFFIDGVYAATITTLPAATGRFGMEIGVQTLTTAAKAISVDFVGFYRPDKIRKN